MKTTVITLLMVRVVMSTSIEGYDCNNDQITRKTYSMSGIETCGEKHENTQTEVFNGQIIQKKSYMNVSVTSCSLIQSTLIYHCGMHSHSAVVSFRSSPMPVELTKQQCLTMISTGSYIIPGTTLSITGLKIGQVTKRELTVNGATSTDGTCTSASFNVGEKVYSAHIRKMEFTILVKTSFRNVDLSTQNVLLANELKCPYQEGSCFDGQSGNHVWSTKSLSCRSDLYDVLYQGPLNVTSSPATSNGSTVLTVRDGTFILAAKLDSVVRVCEVNVRATAVEGLYISYESGGLQQFEKEPSLQPNNNDLTRYFNSKIGYLLYSGTKRDKEIFDSLMNQICKTNSIALRNKIDLLRKDPTGLVSSEGFGKGVLVRPAGEVVHVFKCLEISVQLRESSSCYNEIPVVYNGTDGFLTPNDRIFIKDGTFIPCSPMSAPMFFIKGRWYKFSPGMSEVMAPPALSPSESHLRVADVDWSIINSGIYSVKDMQSLQKFLAFGPRSSAMSSSSVGDNMGLQVDVKNTWLGSPSDIGIKSLSSRIWSFFSTFDQIGIKFGVVGFFFTIILLLRNCITSVAKGIYLKQMGGISHVLLGLLGGTFFIVIRTLRKLMTKDGDTDIERGEPEETPTRNPSAPKVETPFEMEKINLIYPSSF